jgi:hypothetical protein
MTDYPFDPHPKSKRTVRHGPGPPNRYHFPIAFSGRSPYLTVMNSKQRKTLQAVFRTPTSPNILWADLESLLQAAGCEVIEGPGSAVSFKHGQHLEFFHRPHPQKEAKRYQVRAARALLAKLDITP